MAEDKNLTCRDCNNTFVFTAGEQAFFEEKGLSAPIRCPECRRLRKQQRNMDASGPAPGSFAPRSSSGPPRSSEGRPGGGERSSAPPRSSDFTPRFPRPDYGGGGGDDDRKGPRPKTRSAGGIAKFTPPKKEQAAVPKEKRPGNRRDEEKLLINWKEEVGLDDLDSDTDWLSIGEDEDES
ncbi:MAG: zinc-ribbon domain-containing protein [Armatimonadetes bacterium]|nr:zinc-ribbon domain-containing protein [Armatimonadota bacterium]